MQISNDSFLGSLNYPTKVHKVTDEGGVTTGYEVTCDYFPDEKWTAAREQDAIRQAHHGLEQLNQKRQLHKPKWMSTINAKLAPGANDGENSD